MRRFVLTCLFAMIPFPLLGTDFVPNPEFNQGDKSPEGWQLSGGQGRWLDRSLLEVTGTGHDANEWHTNAIRFTPGALYHFQMRARRTSGSGCTVSGPTFANRDHADIASDWRWYGHVFRAPDRPEAASVRVGQWEAKGAVQFDAVRITPVLPIYKSAGNILLGEGESIDGGRYMFHGSFDHEGSNFHRTLASATAGFNSNRWCFGANQQVTYRFHVPGHRFQSGRVSFTVNYHTAGTCLAEASRDAKQWTTLATKSGVGSVQANLPPDLFPADTLFVRLRSTAGSSNFQVNQIEFEAPLDGKPAEGRGRTLFADIPSLGTAKAIDSITLDEAPGSGQATLHAAVKNPETKVAAASLTVSVRVPGTFGLAVLAQRQNKEVPGNGMATLSVKLPIQKPGENKVELDITLAGTPLLKTAITLTVPDFYRADYGELIQSATGPAAVWWCDATHKVPRQRPLPTASAPAAQMSAARNDHEAVQVVVRSHTPLTGLIATASAFTGVNGGTIPAANVKVLRVFYHFVDHPTDNTGVRDWWPDALPPLQKPIDVAAGQNQPLWVLVYVPKDAKPGDYRGSLSLKADGWSAEVPLHLHVWNYTLPEKNHLATAFGLSPGMVFQYHNLKTEADRRKVLDMYWQSFAEHRISTYDPTPMDPIRVRFLPDAKPPRAELDFTAFDRAMARAVEKFHFTNFRLHLEGMGGGTFHERVEPQIGKFGENTPEYRAMFSSFLKQLEDHLRQKDWLNMAYTYWFDEPEPKDYAFVRSGMERIRRYAPGIQRMLTEEPCDELAGAVDIWCPVSPNYDHAKAEKCRARGERFWWYVCCGPKAPFCTLFIDHPATELRVWLWQTWQRKIVGNLVWESNYWTSSAAYPDKAQNPYQDPMGYVSGYSTPRGTKAYWGNGDGRFIYPPEAAAEPGLSGGQPVLEPPVSSIRWEMLREGIEDYESLYLLRELIAKKRGSLPAEELKQLDSLLEVPPAITKDMTTFTTDPTAIYARRKAIAEAIERLSRQ